MKAPAPPVLLQFLQPYDRAIQDLALALRTIVLDELGPCHEQIYDAYSAVAIGYGPTTRLSDGVCHIAVYSKHVNLGFNKGSQLEDPDRVLHGTGKWIRHITIKTAADLEMPAIRRYLSRARECVAHIPGPQRVTSVVKGNYPKKRRPRG